MYKTRLLIGDLRKEDSYNRTDEKYRAATTKNTSNNLSKSGVV